MTETNRLSESYSDVTPKYANNKLIGYSTVNDDAAIANSLRNLFLIRKGEVPGKPWVGNPVTVFLFDNIGHFEEQSIKTSFINTIQNFEPRIEIVKVDIKVESAYNTVDIYLDYYTLYGDKQKMENIRLTLAYNNMTTITTRINNETSYGN